MLESCTGDQIQRNSFSARPVALTLALVALFTAMVPHAVSAAFVLTTFVSLDGTNGQTPSGGLLLGSDGKIYGTAVAGGTNAGVGTVFVVSTNGALGSLTSFNGTNGYNPSAGLVEGAGGIFYSTTSSGGTGYVANTTSSGNGTVFGVTSSGTLASLHSFQGGSEGVLPHSELIENGDGNLYGTTAYGGTYNKGTIFGVTSSGVVTTLASFDGTNGATPWAGLVVGNDGSFYGTTKYGGASGKGTVFKITTNGVISALVSFTGTNGAIPFAGLTLGRDGGLYGTTSAGGTNQSPGGQGFGTVFKLSPDGSMMTVFSLNGTNGWNPQAGLVSDSGGNMYGVTFNGGDAYAPYIFIGYGAVFRLATNGALTRLASFHGTNGASPNGLMAGANGGFYGTTQGGGTYGSGTIFRLDNTPLSQPVIQSVEQMSGTLFITWTAVAGQSYQVQYSTDVSQGNWNNLGGVLVATNSSATASDSVGQDPRRFYRVVVQSP